MNDKIMNTNITKYNPNLKLDEDCEDSNFYQQLSKSEKEEYNDLQINFLERTIDKGYEEISLIDFKTDRNHPDRELYRTDSMSNLVSYEWITDLEEQVKELELKNSKLRKELN